MISGISYNVFNGEEHLLHSLRMMRPLVDYINIVVSYHSYRGVPCRPSLHSVLAEAAFLNLYDESCICEADTSLNGAENELAKRMRGLECAKRAGVTHFMTMDCDEYYLPQEFVAAKLYIEATDVRTTAVPTYLHIRRPIWRSRLPDTTCCAFLTRLSHDSELRLNAAYPAPVDPKRRLHGEDPSFHMFPAEMIAMRHMNLVRTDLEFKLSNSINATNGSFMDAVRGAVAAWRPGEMLSLPRKPPMEIVEVEDNFGIDRYFR